MEKIKYKCGKCNYRFMRKADIKVERCPYCARTGTVEVNSGDYAERLVTGLTG